VFYLGVDWVLPYLTSQVDLKLLIKFDLNSKSSKFRIDL
jgi:hypothetical protein